ncbi:Transposon Ty3-G Gag-Pol poly [Paramuricea clavata]|uniref:Transposon Ty3-G Gag-Pol poly n=1 Tax=Paramuricea clavata TaxID=317549 RepID=A0A7D9E983_PARCT|nr:Transposon Ty3-G Gag-Pol poly [Paramuricea clavata]
MQNQCIFGAEFLKANGMVVNIAQELLSWDSGETRLLIEAAAPTINKLSVLLEKYADVFVNGPDDPLGRTNDAEHSIDTGDSRPVKQRPYRISVHLNKVVNNQVDEMLARGLIRPSDVQPVVLSNCNGPRLNAVTRKDAFPMPRIDEILDKLGGARFFSTLDLASGYWQVPLREEDIPKTAFTVGSNHYEFTVMLFGLTNAPATFQRMMTKLLHGMSGCLVFIDDIIIFADTWEEHQKILEEVLHRIKAAGLKLKGTKCQFGRESVQFLGHIVSARGIHPNPEKVQAVQDFPHRLRCRMSEHLWEWPPTTAGMSVILRISPLLALPNFMIPFTVYTDASDSGLGTVLSQRVGSSEYVVCYASRSLTSAENYSTTEKECLAIVWAIHYWRPYLLGKAFQLVTDHQSLTWLQGLKEPKGRLARWILTLQEYDFAIVHRPGRENSNADALSRSPLPTTVVNHPHLPDEEIVIWVRPTLIETEWSREEICQAQHDGQVWKQLEIIDGVLHRRVSTSGWKDGLVLVVPRKMRADLLRLSHNDPSSGHMGVNRCVERLQPWYYWPGMTSEVHLWVAECDVCNQRKSSSASHRSPMENIRVSQPMELWALMDILGPLPTTAREHQYVLVMSDHFTKWVEAVPMADQKAETVARAFIDNVVSRHGVPVKLLTDQGRNFESAGAHERSIQAVGRSQVADITISPTD